jgi:hypothetical protein
MSKSAITLSKMVLSNCYNNNMYGNNGNFDEFKMMEELYV